MKSKDLKNSEELEKKTVVPEDEKTTESADVNAVTEEEADTSEESIEHEVPVNETESSEPEAEVIEEEPAAKSKIADFFDKLECKLFFF